MGKRLIREHIIATRALVQLPWHEAVKLFLQDERKLRIYEFVIRPWANRGVATTFVDISDEDFAEIIALIAAPISHGSRIKRIGSVMEEVARRHSDRISIYTKEDARETEVRRARAAKTERIRLRKLPR